MDKFRYIFEVLTFLIETLRVLPCHYLLLGLTPNQSRFSNFYEITKNPTHSFLDLLLGKV
jgi:hypothetical protein